MKILALFVIVLIMTGCSQQEFKEQKPDPKILKEKQLRASRELIKKFIPYPDSAKFRYQSGDCGEVSYLEKPNTYSDFKRFVIIEKQMVFIEGSVAQEQFELSWKNTCKSKWS